MPPFADEETDAQTVGLTCAGSFTSFRDLGEYV